jgi:hypothetical protein
MRYPERIQARGPESKGCTHRVALQPFDGAGDFGFPWNMEGAMP